MTLSLGIYLAAMLTVTQNDICARLFFETLLEIVNGNSPGLLNRRLVKYIYGKRKLQHSVYHIYKYRYWKIVSLVGYISNR